MGVKVSLWPVLASPALNILWNKIRCITKSDIILHIGTVLFELSLFGFGTQQILVVQGIRRISGCIRGFGYQISQLDLSDSKNLMIPADDPLQLMF